MADRAHSLPENAEGPFFVDSTCIDCDTCRQIAPATFGETGQFSYRSDAVPSDVLHVRRVPIKEHSYLQCTYR